MWPVVTFLLVLLLAWILDGSRKPKGFPPGPPRLPLLGSIPFLIGTTRKRSIILAITDQVRYKVKRHRYAQGWGGGEEGGHLMYPLKRL